MNVIRFIGAFVLLSATYQNVKSQSANVTATIDSLLASYDKRLRPNDGAGPVEVKVSMYILTLGDVSDSNMDFTADFYFRTYWNDPRLAFANKSNVEKITLGHDFGKAIWLPDLFFVQAKKDSFMHTITSKNEFIKVDHEGNVARSIRLSVRAACPMNFRRFPKDVQTCALSVESYGYSAEDIVLKWKELNTPVGIATTLGLSNFELVEHSAEAPMIHLPTGNYSTLRFEFDLKRLPGFYCTQVYIPSTMLVILSWMTFWLKRRAFNVRLTICGLSLLLMTVGCFVTGLQVPKTNYSKAIDVYTGVCMTFVFTALIQFARVANDRSNESKEDEKTLISDKIFRIAFPSTFIVFMLTYGVVY